MNKEHPLFILAGNGPYENRGCEAIVRGTTKILREVFPDPHFVCISHFQNENQYRIQCQIETDDAITHLTSRRLTKNDVVRSFWKPDSIRAIYQHLFKHNDFLEVYRDIHQYLDDACVVLSIGGDNYSLDYGIPTLFTSLDDLLIERKKLFAIWGASIGPFSAIPDYERYMSDHLQKVTGIFARESSTVEYLDSIGVNGNVYPVADPAFIMDPTKPSVNDCNIEEGAIGLNLSPLMAKFVTGGDLGAWTCKAVSIIEKISEIAEQPIYLIPHVVSPHDNDSVFLQSVISILQKNNKINDNIYLIPPNYNASETKWIISRMSLFIGSRTHATIAGLSSNVPTLSLAYSMKARGINQDIFGHTKYCLNPKDLNALTITSQMSSMLDDKSGISRDLRNRIPVIQKSALKAGSDLKKIING